MKYFYAEPEKFFRIESAVVLHGGDQFLIDDALFRVEDTTEGKTKTLCVQQIPVFRCKKQRPKVETT